MLGWLAASAERSLVGWASACVPLGSECPIRESPKLARAPRRCWLGPRPTRMGGHGLGTARGLGNTRGATTTKAAMSDDPSSVAWSVREGGGLGQRMSQGATVECGHQSIDSHAWPHECRPGARGSIDAIGRCAGREGAEKTSAVEPPCVRGLLGLFHESERSRGSPELAFLRWATATSINQAPHRNPNPMHHAWHRLNRGFPYPLNSGRARGPSEKINRTGAWRAPSSKHPDTHVLSTHGFNSTTQAAAAPFHPRAGPARRPG